MQVAKSGVVNKKTASRKISKISKRFNYFRQSSVVKYLLKSLYLEKKIKNKI